MPTPAIDPALAHLEPHVRRVIDEFRPYILADGGDIEFLGIDARRMVRVRLKGACVGCPASFNTLQMGLERLMLAQVPSVRGVENSP
ncbi:Fe/S biogenesis protein NfuA [Phycisphaerae bacterium RAS1]|nr:Fe/S biogenesis protein NfuA [Phycisphaerae bacterium RAS1]